MGKIFEMQIAANGTAGGTSAAERGAGATGGRRDLDAAPEPRSTAFRTGWFWRSGGWGVFESSISRIVRGCFVPYSRLRARDGSRRDTN
jgi:hypothetical protein